MRELNIFLKILSQMAIVDTTCAQLNLNGNVVLYQSDHYQNLETDQ